MKSTIIKSIFCTLALAFIASSASAHVPFLKPNQFKVLHHRFVIESSYTEFPFQADFAMKVPTFVMISPDGTISPISDCVETKGAVYLQPDITMEGTYRFSTGIRKGPKYRGVEAPNGKLYFSQDTNRVEGKKIELQYFNSADVYVFKGKTNYHPSPLNKGVEIVPFTSPNELAVGGELSFTVLNDGTPVENARVVVAYDDEHYTFHRHGDLYDVENVRESNIHTNSQGKFTFTPKQAGLVLLFVTIHKKINDTLYESYNTSLTLEVNPKFGRAIHEH